MSLFARSKKKKAAKDPQTAKAAPKKAKAAAAGKAPSAMQKVQQFLMAMSAKEITKLTQVVEQDRTQKVLGLPHTQLLALLRPRLTVVRPDRYWSPERLFCLPFEDQLTSADPDKRQTGQITRAAIGPVWKLLTRDVTKMDEAIARIRQHLAKQDLDRAYKAAGHMWSVAANVLSDWQQRVEDDPKTEGKLQRLLGSRQLLTDFQAICNALWVADEILMIRKRIPERPIRLLKSEDCVWIRDIVEKAAEEKPGREPAILMSLTARLVRPSEIFRILRLLTGGTDDTAMQNSTLSVVGDVVLEQLGNTVQEIRRAQIQKKSDEEILALAKVYASEFSTVTSEYNIRKSGRWGEALLETRREVSELIGKTMFGKTPDKIMDALPAEPVRGAPGPGGQRPPGQPLIAAPPDEAQLLKAEKSAQAIADCARIAHVLSAQSAATRAVTDLKKRLDGYARAAVEGARKITLEQEDNAVRNLMAAVRLIEIVAGAEEADLARRRGMTAIRNAMDDIRATGR